MVYLYGLHTRNVEKNDSIKRGLKLIDIIHTLLVDISIVGKNDSIKED